MWKSDRKEGVIEDVEAMERRLRDGAAQGCAPAEQLCLRASIWPWCRLFVSIRANFYCYTFFNLPPSCKTTINCISYWYHWFCCKDGDGLQENNAKLGYLCDTTQKVKRSTLPQNAAARCAHCEAPTPHRSREKCKKQIPKFWQRQPSHFFISSYFIQLEDRYPKVLLQNNETPWSYKHIFFSGLREICEGFQQRIIIMYATDTCIIVRETPHQTEKRFIVSMRFTESERLIDSQSSVNLGPLLEREG